MIKTKLILNGIFKCLQYIKNKKYIQMFHMIDDLLNIIESDDPPENYWFLVIDDEENIKSYNDEFIDNIEKKFLDFGYLLTRRNDNIKGIIIDFKNFLMLIKEKE